MSTRDRRVTWTAPGALKLVKEGTLDERPETDDLVVQKRRRSKDHVWTDEEAAKCVQGLFRKRKARIAIFNMLKSVHKKFYDEASGKHYYYNARTRRVTWSAPKLLSKLQRDISVAGGLDQQQQEEAHKVQRRRSKDHVWTDEEAAKCVQGLFRKRKARIAIFNMLKSVHKKFYDEASGKHYYYNARTRRVTWSAPKLLSKLQRDISVAGGLDQEQQQEEHKVQRRRSKDHVWTDEEAAKCVQGLLESAKLGSRYSICSNLSTKSITMKLPENITTTIPARDA